MADCFQLLLTVVDCFQLLLTVADQSGPMQASATFKMEYSKLYETLSATLRDDQTTLLLYLLIHQNQGMKAFILSRTNIDTLVSDGR